MAIGMPQEEFWHGDLRLCRAYRDAHKLRRDMDDMSQWKAGAYAYRALVAASNAYREWSPGPENPYPEYPMFGTPEQQERAKRAAQQRELDKNKAWLETFAARFNATFGDEQAETPS